MLTLASPASLSRATTCSTFGSILCHSANQVRATAIMLLALFAVASMAFAQEKPEPKADESKAEKAVTQPESTPKVTSEESKPTAETKPTANVASKPSSKEEEKQASPANEDNKKSKAPAKNKAKPAVDPSPATEAQTNGKKPLPKLGSLTNNFIPGTPWRIHDLKRPRPRAVKPGETDDAPPADARVLFGGKDLNEWYHPGIEDEIFEPQWKVFDGYFEIEPRSGSLLTIDSFGSCQFHIEWMIPEGTTGTSQGRGNSGIKFMERYEVQILDSYNNRTYADGQAASIYGQFPPIVNASREQGKWQTYDIVFEAPRYEGEKMVEGPVVTVFHNGVLVQNRRQLVGPTGLRGSPAEIVPPAAPIMLQDHGNRIRFRNIWIREL